MNYSGVLSPIGHTPVAKFEKLIPVDPLLLERDAILAWGYTRAIVSFKEKSLPTLPSESRIAFFISDRGERYLDAVYSDEGMKSTINPPQQHSEML
ncbi:hypothetical protein [Algoriphagus antarcticus]|uniref:Uncharacterized protein n=1 Tax=Algoriphagus antarcticus TaxID=238540 RepID=A0A3E0DXA2_9BACT|nr:hypothetical protein [Algoriphagus antarcticus]REG90692.1 hypothetical protein C8N25_106193 [Algoriphagus antarcticus]